MTNRKEIIEPCFENKNEHDIIYDTILALTQPFTITDLYYILKQLGIVNRVKINDILDDLCDSSSIRYFETKEGFLTFEVIK